MSARSIDGDGGGGPIEPPLADLFDLATDLAVRAGRAIVELRDEAVASATTKSSPTDPVTEADRAAEAIVLDGIVAARPDDAILGEEGADRAGSSGLAWHIDPIDGTTNYVYGLPAYGVSVGVGDDRGMLCGAVYNPVSDELFAATAGAGATLNGDPIDVGPPVDLARALVATGFGYQADRRRDQAAVLAGLLPDIRDIRRLGSAALDLCAVACGRVDAYYELGLNVWDFAAGWLIAAEAGALCTDLAGGPPTPGFLVAAKPDLHPQLVERLRQLGARDATA